ncbi:MAG: phage tail sheath family protein [Chitinophagaceae bacterium]|nr:MAG: phage tail sheath family protein [Chitinophagaceae bacterium]
MAKSYKTPGVYIEEIPSIPPAIHPVETALPVFIGFTELAESDGRSLVNNPVKIHSFAAFESLFGKPAAQRVTVLMDADDQHLVDVKVDPLLFRLHAAIRLFFANGGGPCFICSAGKYPAVVDAEAVFIALSTALGAAGAEPAITLIIIADALLAGEGNFYGLYRQALVQCGSLQNRFVLVDMYSNRGTDSFADLQANFREKIAEQHLSFGAAYYPYLQTNLTPSICEAEATLTLRGQVYKLRLPDDIAIANLDHSLYHADRDLYDAIKNKIQEVKLVLPPSCALAGIYARTDRSRGVWKAPSNVQVESVIKPMIHITDKDQDKMNDDPSGKYVNAIREFPGKGTLVWGARTLAGNDQEWRYVPVKRLQLFIAESVRQSMQVFVLEPNDANTWLKLKAMLENFLYNLWTQGALAGTKPEQAYFVHVGLGSTMTATDILENRLIAQIGFAPVRPAEFILSQFSLKMANE